MCADKPETKNETPYCGINKIPKGQYRGSMTECAEKNQVKFYGLNKVDSKTVDAIKKKTASQGKLDRLKMDVLNLKFEIKNMVKKSNAMKPSAEKDAYKARIIKKNDTYKDKLKDLEYMSNLMGIEIAKKPKKEKKDRTTKLMAKMSPKVKGAERLAEIKAETESQKARSAQTTKRYEKIPKSKPKSKFDTAKRMAEIKAETKSQKSRSAQTTARYEQLSKPKSKTVVKSAKSGSYSKFFQLADQYIDIAKELLIKIENNDYDTRNSTINNKAFRQFKLQYDQLMDLTSEISDNMPPINIIIDAIQNNPNLLYKDVAWMHYDPDRLGFLAFFEDPLIKKIYVIHSLANLIKIELVNTEYSTGIDFYTPKEYAMVNKIAKETEPTEPIPELTFTNRPASQPAPLAKAIQAPKAKIKPPVLSASEKAQMLKSFEDIQVKSEPKKKQDDEEEEEEEEFIDNYSTPEIMDIGYYDDEELDPAIQYLKYTEDLIRSLEESKIEWAKKSKAITKKYKNLMAEKANFEKSKKKKGKLSKSTTADESAKSVLYPDFFRISNEYISEAKQLLDKIENKEHFSRTTDIDEYRRFKIQYDKVMNLTYELQKKMPPIDTVIDAITEDPSKINKDPGWTYEPTRLGFLLFFVFTDPLMERIFTIHDLASKIKRGLLSTVFQYRIDFYPFNEYKLANKIAISLS